MESVTVEDQALMGKLMVLAPRLMAEAGVTGGFRQIINTGRDGGQEVQHLHMHVIGGPRPWVKG
jgi:histidine triad (HIT) family protein